MDALIEALFTVVFYGIGRLIITGLSLGLARGERWDEKLKFPWYALKIDDNRKLVASSGLCAVIGILTCAGIVAAIVLLRT